MPNRANARNVSSVATLLACVVPGVIGVSAVMLVSGCCCSPRQNGGSAIDAPNYTGEWTLTRLGGTRVADMLPSGATPPTLTINQDGSAAGFAGVNRFTTSFDAGASARGEALFGPVGTTRMAGPQPLMDLEFRFLEALRQARSSSIEAENLVLLDGGGASVATLAPAGR